MGIIVGINASRNRSGGAKVHLLGILNDSDPRQYGIREIHVWSYKALLEKLPTAPFLIKHNHPELERSLLHQVCWEYHSLPEEARKAGCDIMLNTDAGTVCDFHPSVVMSRDMLSYEWKEMMRYGLSAMLLRLIVLRFIQTASMKRADGVIFLTNYAARVIQATTGKLRRTCIIPHGVGLQFKQKPTGDGWLEMPGQEIRCLYVSNAEMYKHQWVVVRAIAKLRRLGYNVRLSLVGGGSGRAQRLLEKEISIADPGGEFIESRGYVSNEMLPQILAKANLFIFASSCENMPNTLVEAMSSGLPIACSNRGPMPEILGDGGIYFDPENADSISSTVETLIQKRDLRRAIASRAQELAKQYSWQRCASETWGFLRESI